MNTDRIRPLSFKIPFPFHHITFFILLLLCVPSFSQDQLRPWTDYRTIMWTSDSAYRKPDKIPLYYQRLREMGINTGMVGGDGSLKPLLDNQFPYYVENIINRGLCLKWNSKVRDWDKFVTTWAKTGRPESALVRDFCLDDPQWLAWARKETQSIVNKNKPHQPLAIDIRDELSTTISANPFDYDFNPITLRKFREWLQTQYPTLEALNAEWETQFATWDEVKPFTTDQIKNRMGSGDARPRGKPDWGEVAALKFEPQAARKAPTRWNFAPWADFRTYMDISLANALNHIRQAAHEIDPATPLGIEGTQMPHAFGGYDLWRLAQVLDWVEPYDIACSREIFGSFMPGRSFVTTVFEKDTNPARRRLWHLLLQGDKACIIWWSEDCIDWNTPDYALTQKAKALAPVLREMTSPLAKIFLRAERQFDPIFIHYSQPSIQADWLIESTIDGSTWLRRFSSFESDHNRMAKVRASWLKAFQDLGYTPKFLASEQIETGALDKVENAVLVLPTSLALSDKEAEKIKGFLTFPQSREQTHLVFADGTPGLFDAHGKLRRASPLENYFPPATSSTCSYVALGNSQPQTPRQGDIARYGADRLKVTPSMEWTEWISKQLVGIPREVSLPASARVQIYRYRLGSAQLVAFERNISYAMSEELKQAGGNEALEQPIDIEATLAKHTHVYDLRVQKYLGHLSRISCQIDPWQPSLFALLPEKVVESELISQLAR